MDVEELHGGNSNAVTRIGTTVRRPTGAWTPAVHRLLAMLREAGITEVPEAFGIDDEGREVLSFIRGDVGHYPMPPWVWSDAILRESGRLLRRLHDASATVATERMTWQLPTHHPVEVVCHNDVAPYNLVFRDGHVVGLIDFDTASPGPRIWDFAYLAYRLVPLGGDADVHAPAPDEQPVRLAALIAAYGGDFSPAEVRAAAADRLDELALFTDGRAAQTGRTDFVAHAAMYRRDRDRLRALTA